MVQQYGSIVICVAILVAVMVFSWYAVEPVEELIDIVAEEWLRGRK